ncbi:hypothetical protein [Bifidobacterium callitrichidarum]|uniref:Uncharacterized protein n=1 Tax=Bifidobacterium callitrichidarum TaxID=2052941 RepID=A0A2U2N8Z7_9BIFI|nr:hypothetical protein [Bifidobacterium callitrichidarum]PWG65577.1 hypothetical protein DF196_06480 [Bifidobacterium callitrichidarum]
MSYPWGEENYPTIEQLENEVSQFRESFYTNLRYLNTALEEECKTKAAKRPITINLTINGGQVKDHKKILEDAYEDAAQLAYEDTEPTLQQYCDNWGIAFARALADMGIDNPDVNLNRLFQDLFNVLEDKTISRMDKQMQEKAEAEYQRRLAEAQAKAEEEDNKQ